VQQADKKTENQEKLNNENPKNLFYKLVNK